MRVTIRAGELSAECSAIYWWTTRKAASTILLTVVNLVMNKGNEFISLIRKKTLFSYGNVNETMRTNHSTILATIKRVLSRTMAIGGPELIYYLASAILKLHHDTTIHHYRYKICKWRQKIIIICLCFDMNQYAKRLNYHLELPARSNIRTSIAIRSTLGTHDIFVYYLSLYFDCIINQWNWFTSHIRADGSSRSNSNAWAIIMHLS